MWNSLREFKVQNAKLKVEEGKEKLEDIKPKMLSEIGSLEKQRVQTGFSEMDGVLGGGIVKGSVVLLAGDPGVGKSTLLLQIALNISTNNKVVLNKVKDPLHQQDHPEKKILLRQLAPIESGLADQNDNPTVLYISGEESSEQVKLRADRVLEQLNGKSKNKNPSHFLLLSLTNVDNIILAIEQTKPSLVIIDSIQTMESQVAGGLSGSVSQIRYATATFIKLAKTLAIPIILVGHVTKEGMIAGPMMLSHMVDVVLFLEGEKQTNIRILRSYKNRFGPVDEVGIFQMDEAGLKEVKEPEQFFLSEKPKGTLGSVLASTLEGTRVFLVEIQSLVVFSKLPFPRRVALGIDAKRLELLLAVLQRYARLPLETMDVFVNVAGGLKITDRAADLSICLAIVSSMKNIDLSKTVAISEVGLLGELRMVSFLSKRVKEAQKLGFKQIITAQNKQFLRDVIQSLGK